MTSLVLGFQRTGPKIAAVTGRPSTAALVLEAFSGEDSVDIPP
ncbi:MAG: hypothetical protein ACP5O0_11080 [Acidimicrobiales bacterium]